MLENRAGPRSSLGRVLKSPLQLCPSRQLGEISPTGEVGTYKPQMRCSLGNLSQRTAKVYMEMDIGKANWNSKHVVWKPKGTPPDSDMARDCPLLVLLGIQFYQLQREQEVHSKLRSITPVATKVHVILRSFVVLTWMCDIIGSVQHVTLWNSTEAM